MGRYRWMLVLALAAMLACNGELTTRERMVGQELLQDRLSAWVRHMNNAHEDSLVGLYHQVPELVVIWPEGDPTVGWEATRGAWADFYGRTDYMNFALQGPRVELLSARHAVATFRHSTDVLRAGKRAVSSGHGTIVWVKDQADGRWKIHVSQISFTAPSSN